jgi:hypothetical protein
MSLCAASARAFSVTGSSSAIADRNWAMILSLACTSFHKCLFSLASDVDSKDEQVEVLSPRWLCRMVAADCRLYTRHEKDKLNSSALLLCFVHLLTQSLTWLYCCYATSNSWGPRRVSFERCLNLGPDHWWVPMTIQHRQNHRRDPNHAIPIPLWALKIHR